MKLTGRSLAILASFFLSTTLYAAPGYRLVPLDDGKSGTMVFGLNNHGVVVGMRNTGTGTHAFRWRAGRFTDLHDTIDPSVTYTQATGINDRGDIVGDKWNGTEFESWKLHDGTVTAVTVPGGSQVTPFDINNRGQITLDAIVDGRDGFYFFDGTSVQPLDGPDGSHASLFPRGLNNRGVVGGYDINRGGAILWQDGIAESLGVPPGATGSSVIDVNDRNQAAGNLAIDGRPRAAWWRQGTWTVLPKLDANEQQSATEGINVWGMVIGESYGDFNQPDPATATLWFRGRAYDLNQLVRADDPLKPYVHLGSTEQINDRGDIIVSGVDSRTKVRVVYFATLFDN